MSEKNPFPDENNTGHIWDDNLRELENDPPKWWMIGIYASIAFVVGYFILYPSIPLLSSHTKGVLGWTSTGEYHAGREKIEAVRAPYEDRIAGMDVEQIMADGELRGYSVRAARVLFADNCAPCHGAGGQGGWDTGGNILFPILANDDWLWGGTIARIHETIAVGRRGAMPPMGGMALSDAEIGELAQAIAAGDPLSSPLYMSKGCIACHGPDGKGNIFLGSADLTNRIWRFGDGSAASIEQTIRHGVNDANDPLTRTAEMPAFSGRLSESDLKKLAIYVHQFGGGQ